MILSYNTVKYVSIQDSRLGILRYLLMILILLYVGYIEMYMNGGYLLSDSIHDGVLRFTIQQPTIHNCDPFNDNSVTPCENNFLPLQELFYCQQHYNIASIDSTSRSNNNESSNDNNDTYPGNIYPCQYFEAINAQIITETSVTIITRAKGLNQTFICGDNDDESSDIDNDDKDKGYLSNFGSNSETCPHTYQTILQPPSFTNTSTANTTNTSTTIIPFYVAQSEAFTILIDHAVTATKLCQMMSSSVSSSSYTCSSSSSNQYHDKSSSSNGGSGSSSNRRHYIPSGRLYTTNIDLCQQYTSYPTIWSINNNSSSAFPTSTIQSSCYIEPNLTINHLDYYSMDVLIRAAGINSLDDCIDDNGSSSATTTHNNNNNDNSNRTTCTTYRESGATFMVHVIWNDFIPYYYHGSGGMVQPYYYYRVQLINKSYKTYIPYYHNNYRRGGRTLVIAHGIRFVFVLGGEFHIFHFTTFLITFTTALGLFAIATTIIDYLMIYILPEKEKYTKAKYEATDVINTIEILDSIVPPFIHQSLNTMSTTREQEENTTAPEDTNASSSTSLNAADESTLREPLLSNNSLPSNQ